jgi:hypothetical protein
MKRAMLQRRLGEFLEGGRYRTQKIGHRRQRGGPLPFIQVGGVDAFDRGKQVVASRHRIPSPGRRPVNSAATTPAAR